MRYLVTLEHLDTLFEGVVLIITGLGIYTLLNYQDQEGQDERE